MAKRKKNAKKALQPATPTIQDMVGCRIQYVHARPYMRENMIETGVITEVKLYKGLLYMMVKPDNARLMVKQISEHDFIRYVHNVPAAAHAIAIAVQIVQEVAISEVA